MNVVHVYVDVHVHVDDDCEVTGAGIRRIDGRCASTITAYDVVGEGRDRCLLVGFVRVVEAEEGRDPPPRTAPPPPVSSPLPSC